MSGYDDGGSGVCGMMGISDSIIDIFQNLQNLPKVNSLSPFLRNLRQKTNTLVSTIPNSTRKKEIMSSFCKDFSMKLKHHSIPNTIVRSSLSRDFSTKSLSSDCENNWKLPRLDIKSFETEIVNAYDLDLSLYQA